MRTARLVMRVCGEADEHVYRGGLVIMYVPFRPTRPVRFRPVALDGASTRPRKIRSLGCVNPKVLK